MFKKVMMNEETFNEWFEALIQYAALLDSIETIDVYNKDSYREYYDDGDSPEEVFAQEIESKFSRIH
jgi:hypothetical protein